MKGKIGDNYKKDRTQGVGMDIMGGRGQVCPSGGVEAQM